AIAAGGVGSAFAYFKFFGVGEMVECGNCGATISADATSCPKCGVEFDMDTVKCSECGEWIPADLDICPECGVEFVKTGEEVEDYTERMRKQYKKFIRKKKREAQEELGKELSQREFMDWWKDTPSFVTFEEWLRRKEKQRREGSQECPECGTLNSVDDAVCQKCGTSLIDLGEGEEDEEVFLEEEAPEDEIPEPAEEKMPEPSEEEEPLESEEMAEESEQDAEESGESEKKKEQKKVKKKPKTVKKKVVKKPDEDED
ncbi:MAG: zinc ribbon domain-containing protein, partial [Candidatus Natronoplasma sp.]